MNNSAIFRIFDLTIALLLLLFTSPIIVICLFLVWLYDRNLPIYVSQRVGRHNKPFRMFKMRSMTISKSKNIVNSTTLNDSRITPIGHFIRKTKVDELLQLINVLLGDMSIVGPRPNTFSWGVEFYTSDELSLLSCRPGITCLSSIVFSDEGLILEGSEHPDLLYNQIIRPWKSRLGLIYIYNRSIGFYFKVIFLTFLNLFNRSLALKLISSSLLSFSSDSQLLDIVLRETSKPPAGAPPGSDSIFSIQ